MVLARWYRSVTTVRLVYMRAKGNGSKTSTGLRDNGSSFNARPGANPHWNHKNRFPIRQEPLRFVVIPPPHGRVTISLPRRRQRVRIAGQQPAAVGLLAIDGDPMAGQLHPLSAGLPRASRGGAWDHG